jgi:hypothetical protein
MNMFFLYGKYRLSLLIVSLVFPVGSTVFCVVGPKSCLPPPTVLFLRPMRRSATGAIDFGRIAIILIRVLIFYIISTLFGFFPVLDLDDVTQKTLPHAREISD